MARLFQRKCSAVVDGVRVDGLRIAFSVKKSLAKEPNTAELKISNLAEATRAKLRRKGAPVILTAGYPDNAAIIFSGDARLVDHVREGADWITTITCGDGERAYQFARFSESFAPGTAIVDVCRQAAHALGLNVGNLEEALAAGDFRGGLHEYTHGYAAHGRASAELDKALRTLGLSWSVQDGAIQVLRGGAPAAGTAVLLTSDTGLIGSPQFGAGEKKGSAPILKARCLLQPQIRCGGQVEIRAGAVKGFFRVDRVTYAGDTHGGDWFTDLEGRPL